MPWAGHSSSLQPKIKILLGFYQVCLVLDTVYSARLPDKYTHWTDKLSDVISIDWTALFLPVQCVPYELRLLALALSPVGLVALLLLVGVCMRLRRWLAASERPRVRDAVRRGILDLTPPSLVLIFCFVPSVSSFIFRAWSCQAYVKSSQGADQDLIKYTKQDASVVCSTSDHDSIKAIAGVLIALCTRRSSSSSTSRSTGKLQARCREPPPFYIGSTRSVGTIGRRSSCCARLSSPAWSRSSRRRTPFCVLWWLVCSCYAVGLAVAKPYKRIEDDVLAVATNLVLLLVFLGASWITLFDAIDEEAPGKADDRISDSISQRNFRIFESSLRLEPSPGLGHFHYI